MKLYGSTASPYVRLCRLAAEARALDLPFEVVNPIKDDDFRRTNPLAKVPALKLDDGTLLPDSGTILRFLDEQGEAESLYTRSGMRRFETDALVAVSMGVLDLAVAWLLEARRPETERSPSWQDRRRAGVAAGLDEMNAAAADLPDDAGMADLAFGATCDWLSFRQPDLEWRDRQSLAVRVDREVAGPRFQATDPRAG